MSLVEDTLARCSGTKPLLLSTITRHQTVQLPSGECMYSPHPLLPPPPSLLPPSLPPSLLPPLLPSVCSLCAGSSHLFSIPNAVHRSCSLEVYLQTGQEDARPNMLLELTAQIVSEPCFNILRTKEQLGQLKLYSVSVTIFMTLCQPTAPVLKAGDPAVP